MHKQQCKHLFWQPFPRCTWVSWKSWMQSCQVSCILHETHAFSLNSRISAHYNIISHIFYEVTHNFVRQLSSNMNYIVQKCLTLSMISVHNPFSPGCEDHIAWHHIDHRINSITSGQLILTKIIKTVATRCQILQPKCNNWILAGWGCAPDHAGGAYSASHLAGGEGGLLLE